MMIFYRALFRVDGKINERPQKSVHLTGNLRFVLLLSIRGFFSRLDDSRLHPISIYMFYDRFGLKTSRY